MNSLACSTAMVALVGGLSGLAAQSPPKPQPGRAVTTWQAKATEGFDVRKIYARNDTTVPIIVTGVRIANCVNLRVACEPFTPELVVIKPRGISEVATLLPADIFKKFAFTSDLEWRQASETELQPRTPAAGEGHSSPPRALTMILPPVGGRPASLRGQSITVDFFIGTSGAVDSVSISPGVEVGYLKTLRRVMMAYQFRPATQDGWRVPGWTRITITF